MPKIIERFQCMNPNADDPEITIYLGNKVVDEITKETRVEMDSRYPVTVKRSELKSLDDLFDVAAMTDRQDAKKDNLRQDFTKRRADEAVAQSAASGEKS